MQRKTKGCLLICGAIVVLIFGVPWLYEFRVLPLGKLVEPSDFETVTIYFNVPPALVLDHDLTVRVFKNTERRYYLLPVQIWVWSCKGVAKLKDGKEQKITISGHDGTFTINGQGNRYVLRGESRKAWNEDVRALMKSAAKSATKESKAGDQEGK